MIHSSIEFDRTQVASRAIALLPPWANAKTLLAPRLEEDRINGRY
jgi:hypothetical protein